MHLGIDLSLSGTRSAGGGGAPPSYSAEATALFAAMNTQPDATRKGLIDTLISALVASGVWAKLTALYVMQGADAADARLNWKNPGTNTLSYGGTMAAGDFTTDRGFLGDGVDKHLNTGINDNTLSLNSVCVGAWVNQDGGGTASSVSTTSGTTTFRVIPRDGSARVSVRTHSGNLLYSTVPNRLGYTVGNRADAVNASAYKNGSLLTTGASASTTLTSANITILRDSTNYANDRIIVVLLATSLDATEQGAGSYTPLNTFLTAIGGA